MEVVIVDIVQALILACNAYIPASHADHLPLNQIAQLADDVVEAVHRPAERVAGFVSLLIPLGALEVLRDVVPVHLFLRLGFL